jgi:hypothetical protein
LTQARSMSGCESVYLETLDVFSPREENEADIYMLANVVQGENGPLPAPTVMEEKIMKSGEFSEVHAFMWKGTVEFNCRGHILFDLLPRGSPTPAAFHPEPSGSADLPRVFSELSEQDSCTNCA